MLVDGAMLRPGLMWLKVLSAALKNHQLPIATLQKMANVIRINTARRFFKIAP
jgi:hypothetical protein